MIEYTDAQRERERSTYGFYLFFYGFLNRLQTARLRATTRLKSKSKEKSNFKSNRE